MSAVQELIVRIGANITSFQNEMQRVQNEMGNIQNKFSSVGSKVTSIGQNLSKSITLPIVGIATASVKTAADFESSMSKVAALSGATGKDLEDLTNLAKEMGSSTQFSASQCADALGYMALAGWNTQQSMEGLPGVLNLAAASGMDLASASDAVTDILSAFGMGAGQASEAADQFAYAQAHANTSADQLTQAMSNCGVNAHGFGQDLTQTNAMLMGLSNEMLKGSEAGTALSAVFRDMNAKMQDGAIKIGNTKVAVTDANGNFRDMTDILADVEKATNGMSESEKQAALSSTFTADSIKAMGILLNEGSGKIKGYADQLENCGGSAEEMASVMQDNLNGQLTALGSAIEGAAISIGEALLPVIKNIVSAIQGWVDWFNSLSDSTKTTIVVIGLIVAAIGPLLVIIGTLISSIGTIITAFQGIQAAAALAGVSIGSFCAPVLIAVGVIGALIAVGVALYKNWDTIKAKASEIWNNVKEIISNAMKGIKSTINAVWNTISTVITTVLNTIKTGISMYFNFYKTIITTILNAIKTVATTVWNGISSVVSNVCGSISNTVSSKFNAVKNTISNAINSAKNIVKSGLDKISSFFSGCKLNLPKIKLPHFSISGKLSVNPPSVPKIAVKWYAKGAIMTKPTLFGGGEAGPEAILPLDKIQKYFDAAFINVLGKSKTDDDTIKYLKILIRLIKDLQLILNIDGKEFVREVVAPHQDELDDYNNTRNPKLAY